jgi:hypothetical protein
LHRFEEKLHPEDPRSTLSLARIIQETALDAITTGRFISGESWPPSQYFLLKRLSPANSIAILRLFVIAYPATKREPELPELRRRFGWPRTTS